MFRRRRSHTPLVLVAVIAAIAGLSVAAARAAATADAGVAPAAAEPQPGSEPAAEPPAAAAVAATDSTPLFAHVSGVYLRLPADDVVVLGFHEAATREPLALSPLGSVLDHQNTTKFDPPPADDAGTPYVVLSSRGRPMPATSAADLVMPEGVAVRAPVDGEVTDVREYYLYGKHLDQRIEIAPAANPDLRVVMIHVDGVAVDVGDTLVAGETVVAAQARRFGFSSHIDRYTEPDRHGHVHLEVKPVTADEPEDVSAASPGRG
ncbi:MAG TPA: M23 family metallopeptidase [Egicoccus sp.]|nr:M23 family metallopeptidase [Egicoccus sp.]HSK24938.1 M23 family metallopeptidase [Egicoccus sp.]